LTVDTVDYASIAESKIVGRKLQLTGNDLKRLELPSKFNLLQREDQLHILEYALDSTNVEFSLVISLFVAVIAVSVSMYVAFVGRDFLSTLFCIVIFVAVLLHVWKFFLPQIKDRNKKYSELQAYVVELMLLSDAKYPPKKR